MVIETITVAMPQEEADKLFAILKANSMTIDQAADMFFRWIIHDTAAALKWIGIDIRSNKLPHINIISQQEFCAHSSDDVFLRRYGNPVAIRSDDGRVLVCMAIEYYEQITGDKVNIVEDK